MVLLLHSMVQDYAHESIIAALTKALYTPGKDVMLPLLSGNEFYKTDSTITLILKARKVQEKCKRQVDKEESYRKIP